MFDALKMESNFGFKGRKYFHPTNHMQKDKVLDRMSNLQFISFLTVYIDEIIREKEYEKFNEINRMVLKVYFDNIDNIFIKNVSYQTLYIYHYVGNILQDIIYNHNRESINVYNKYRNMFLAIVNTYIIQNKRWKYGNKSRNK